MKHKKLKTILAAVLLVFIMQNFAYGVNIDEYNKDPIEASGADELSEYLSEEAKGYLEAIGCDELDFEKILSVSPKSIFELVFELIRGGITEPLKAMLKSAGIVLLVSVCSGFFPDDEKTRSVLNLICGCVTVTGVFSTALKSVQGAVSAIGICVGFERALIPVLAGVVTASGNPSLALTFQSAAFGAAEFIGEISENFVLPLIGISGALGIIGSMLPTLKLSAISEVIRKTLTTVLTCSAGLFTGFLSLKSVLAASADGLVTKGVKMASSFVPVVGGALGEAYTSVTASLSLVKNTVGIYAIIAFFAIGLPIVINLALWVFAMRVACAVSDLLDCRVCSEILKNTAFIFTTVNSVLLLCMAVFIISAGLVITVKTGV